MAQALTPSRLRAAVVLLAWSLSLAIMLGRGAALAEGLLHIADCRIVDDRGPVKAMGVNYVDGFWHFAKTGDRQSYLPALDALAQNKVRFIRMAFGPWARPNLEGPSGAQIGDFVAQRELYFDRLDAFLDDAKARHIGVVLNVFWVIDPYVTYFGEAETAWSNPNSRTVSFLREIVTELGRRRGADPTIWMIEFLNEGNLSIDFPRARHSRAELVALINTLATTMREAGDRHLISTGNSLPRPAAEHLNQKQGWIADGREAFLEALDAETPAQSNVASVHVYPEKKALRPWDDGDVLNALPLLSAFGRKTCKPVFVGEFGASGQMLDYIDRVAKSDVQLAAAWGYGRRPTIDPFAFGIDAEGREILQRIGQVP